MARRAARAAAALGLVLTACEVAQPPRRTPPRDAGRAAAAAAPADGDDAPSAASPSETAAPGVTPPEPEAPPDCDFEKGLEGWTALWTREAGKGTASHDTDVARSGEGSVRIEHTGSRDWSLSWKKRSASRRGDMFEIAAWVKVEGEGGATLCATLRDAGGEVMDWVFAGRSLRGTGDWKRLRSRFAAPAGAVDIEARLIGEGPATVWMDDFSFRKTGNVADMQGADMPEEITLGNKLISVTVEPREGALAVRDLRTGKTWRQLPFAGGLVVRQTKKRDAPGGVGAAVTLGFLDVVSGHRFLAKLRVEPEAPELVIEIDAPRTAKVEQPLSFPSAFAPVAGTYLVIPMNEGISYPVEDASIDPMRLIAYGGHGICMAFWGATDGSAGHMTILETPDDAALRIARADGLLAAGPEWQAQRGSFGYVRRLRHVFFERGGHVAIAKRYREYAKATGLLKTLAEKRADNPNVDMLIGAVNVWSWDPDAPGIVREMREAGIERILWSNRRKPDELRELNSLGVLTSRYDIYQDVMDPAKFDRLRWVHPDWTTEAWPKDLMLGPGGEWVRGWKMKAKDGEMIPCGTLCDARAPEYARKRIAKELKGHPFRCRFIDTTTATPWRECYDPAHPMTRSDSRRAKMELLDVVSREMKLVTGCETGHDASVPFLHYFEGMMSLGPYRVPDAGRDMG
ncbi:MAG: glycoside hydrolase, partial [Planctomycetota bacterium]